MNRQLQNLLATLNLNGTVEYVERLRCFDVTYQPTKACDCSQVQYHFVGTLRADLLTNWDTFYNEDGSCTLRLWFPRFVKP